MLIVIKPTEIREGDVLCNVGIVSKIETRGMFTTVECPSTDWSPLTGRGHSTTRWVTFHAAEEVVVGRDEPRKVVMVDPGTVTPAPTMDRETAESVLAATATLIANGTPMTPGERAQRLRALDVVSAATPAGVTP